MTHTLCERRVFTSPKKSKEEDPGKYKSISVTMIIRVNY